MKKTLLLALIVLLVGSTVFAQSASRRRSSTPAATYQLSITSNAPGYVVFVDGQEIKGNATTVQAGSHTVVVRADGYQDWQRTINVTSNTTIRADLEPNTFQLQVRPNISNAQVYIDGRRVGSGSVAEVLRPGTYTIRISAPGFIDFSTTIRLSGDQVVRASLRPAPARVIVQIPDDIQTPGTRDVISLVKIFLNGSLQPSNVFDVEPGRHTIRLTSGGFSVEQTYILDAGRTYTIVPNLTLTISQ